MKEFLVFYQGHALEIVGGMGIILITISFIQWIKIHQIKKTLNRICDSVAQYLSCVVQGEEEEMEMQKTIQQRKQKEKQAEEQNRIIASVLEEIFP